MNYTVIPKSIVNFQTGNSKPVDIYVWATIKCCSNHKTNISHVTEEKLSLLTGLDERTIRRVIKRLKDASCLTVQTTVKEDADRGFIKRNSYYIKPANKDYFFLDNSFFKRNYPAKIAGFLFLLKAICLNNTDTVQWSNAKIAEAIGLSRNTTTALLNECQQLGLIKRIAKGYELTAGCFINSAVRKTDAGIYKEICDFCKSKGITPPIWDKRAMSVLLTKYNSIGLSASEPITITYQLNKRCKNLPEKVSLAYFVKALDMQEQYKAVAERAKQAKQFKEEFRGFAF
jgi:DNA-binding Lrp family transcriptional regulator